MSLLCTYRKRQRAALCGSGFRCVRALPTGHRKPFQPASALAPATGKLRAKACRRAPTTFTKDAGQRAAHRGAVPGHPRELTGLDQNRDIDDALLRGGLRLAEAEFRPTKGRRSTGWEFGATGHRRRSSASVFRAKEGQCGHESRRSRPDPEPRRRRFRKWMGHAGRIGSRSLRQSLRGELGRDFEQKWRDRALRHQGHARRGHGVVGDFSAVCP